MAKKRTNFTAPMSDNITTLDAILAEKLPKLTLDDLPLEELSIFVRRLIGESEMTKVRQTTWGRELAEFGFVLGQALDVLLRDGWTADEARGVLRRYPKDEDNGEA